MTAGTEPLWLTGFFTGRRHTVVDLADRTDFHGVTLAWSVCNRPVVLHPDATSDPTAEPANDSVCPDCACWFDAHVRYR
jgi:hypothetical protein